MRRFVRGLAAVFVLLLILAVVAPMGAFWPLIRSGLNRSLLAPMGLELQGGHVGVGLVPSLRVSARDVALVPRFTEEGLRCRVAKLDARMQILPLLRGRVRLSRVAIDSLDIESLVTTSTADDGPGIGTALLRRVQVDDLRMTSLRKRVFAPESADGAPIQDLHLAYARMSLGGVPGGVEVHLDSLDLISNAPHDIALSGLSGDITIHRHGVSARQLRGRSGPTRFAVDLTAGDGLVELDAQLEHFEMRLARPLMDHSITGVPSSLDGEVQIRLEDGDLAMQGNLCGWFGPLDLDADSLAIRWDGTFVHLDHASGSFAGIRVHVDEGFIDSRTEDYEARGDILGLDLGRYFSWTGPTNLTGAVSLAGAHFSNDNLWLDLEAEGVHGSLLDLDLLDGKGAGRYEAGNLWIDRSNLRWRGTSLRSKGTIHEPDPGAGHELALAISASIEADSPLIDRFVPVDDVSARLEIDGRVIGPTGAPRLTATYGGEDFEYAGLVVGPFRGELDLDSLWTRPTGQVSFRGREGGMGIFPLDEAELTIRARGRRLDVSEFRFETGARRLQGAGTFFLKDGFKARLVDLRFSTPGVVARASSAVELEHARGRTDLGPVALNIAGGTFDLSGGWDDIGGLDLDYRATGLDLSQLVRFWGAPGSADGILDARGAVGGDWTDPTIEATVSAKDVRLGPMGFGRTVGEMRLHHGALEISNLRSVHAGGLVELKGVYPVGPHMGWNPAPDVDLPVDLTIRTEALDLARVGPALFEGSDVVAGELDGEVRISGRLDHPSFLGQGAVDNLRVAHDSYGDVELDVGYSDATLSISGVAGQKVSAEGTLPIVFCPVGRRIEFGDEPVDVATRLDSLDIAFVRHLVPDVDRARGHLNFEGRLGGSLPWPTAHGQVGLDDGWVKIAWMGNALSQVRARGTIDGAKLRIDQVAGRMGRGRWEAQGDIKVRDYVPIDYRMDVRGSYIPVDWVPELRAVVDVDLAFRDNVLITGDVEVRDALFTRDFGEEPEPLPPPPLPGEEMLVLRYDLDVNAERNVRLRNRDAQMELKGAFTIHNLASSKVPATGEIVPFCMVGELEVIRGIYTVLGKSTFEVEDGRIRMLDPFVLDPEVEATATATIRERTQDLSGDFTTNTLPVELTLGGNFFSDLTYEFRDVSGGGAGEIIPTEDVVLLLTFGRRRAAVAGGGLYDSETLLADAGALTAQLLEARVREVLDITLDISTGTVSPFESLDETYVGLGKYVNDRLFVYYSQYLSADPRRKVGVEYNLSDRVLLSGEVDETDIGDSDYNVDLRYRVEY